MMVFSNHCHTLCRYDPLSACLVDFKGRANIASVKNAQFILSSPRNRNLSHDETMRLDGEKDYILQLGKTTEDCFNMDFRPPLSLFQAFAISIARYCHILS